MRNRAVKRFAVFARRTSTRLYHSSDPVVPSARRRRLHCSRLCASAGANEFLVRYHRRRPHRNLAVIGSKPCCAGCTPASASAAAFRGTWPKADDVPIGEAMLAQSVRAARGGRARVGAFRSNLSAREFSRLGCEHTVGRPDPAETGLPGTRLHIEVPNRSGPQPAEIEAAIAGWSACANPASAVALNHSRHRLLQPAPLLPQTFPPDGRTSTAASSAADQYNGAMVYPALGTRSCAIVGALACRGHRYRRAFRNGAARRLLAEAHVDAVSGAPSASGAECVPGNRPAARASALACRAMIRKLHERPATRR